MNKIIGLITVLFLLLPLTALAQDYCEGDFNCDGDVDGTDASLFKSDFGRSSMQNPCPACEAGEWCMYQIAEVKQKTEFRMVKDQERI